MLPMPSNSAASQPILPWLTKIMEEMGARPDSVQYVKDRTEFGKGKYGQELHTFDGRDPIQDAKMEAGDMCQYLTKAMMEASAQGKSLGRIFKALEDSIQLLDMLTLMETNNESATGINYPTDEV